MLLQAERHAPHLPAHVYVPRGLLLPRPRGAFFELVAANPDLYGPFWIATTLIFAMAITGNLASYVNFVETPAKKEWTYDFSLLTLAGTVVYLYVTLLPMLFWMLMVLMVCVLVLLWLLMMMLLLSVSMLLMLLSSLLVLLLFVLLCCLCR